MEGRNLAPFAPRTDAPRALQPRYDCHPSLPPTQQELNQLRGDATLAVVVETHTVVVEAKEATLEVQVRTL